MRCTGCGKDIPFNGEVCPYCQRDKSSDQAIQVFGTIAMFVGAGIGGLIGGFSGTIIGAMVLGVPVVFIGVAMGSNSAKQPPAVRVDSLPVSVTDVQSASDAKVATAEADPTLRLGRLAKLRDDGLITETEYAARRAAIINDL